MKRFLAIAALGALLAGCSQSGGSSSGGAGGNGTQAGTLRIAVQSDLKNLNPLLQSNTTDAIVANLMFEPLLAANAKGDPVPMLATTVPTIDNGGISKDGLTITYHLRTDAKWTDGVPVTSKDVKWTWQAIMNDNNNVLSRNGYDDVSSIDTPNDDTVVVHLKKKFSPFVNTFFADSDSPMEIAPAHVLASYPNVNQIPFNADPDVSDGPFKFVRWVHGDHIELSANPDFFMGKPGLNNIYIRIVPDENTTVNLLRTHEIDWMFQASINNYPQIKDIPGIHIVWDNMNGYEGVYLNMQRPYLQNPLVRQAIVYAIDKKRIVQTSTYGQEQEATEDQPPFMWSFDPNIPATPYNLQKARALLEQAGWTPGPGGIMQKDGQPLTLVMVSNSSNATRRKNSQLIQETLRQAGINVQIKYYDGDVLFAPAGEGGIMQGGKFDLALSGWIAGIDPDDSTQLTCSNVAPNGVNYSRYCSAAMDAAQQVALTHYDRPTRKKAYFQIQELLHKDNPVIYLWWERFMEPVNVDFKGFDPNPAIETWNAWQWSI